MVCQCQLSHLPWYFSLREEARKSWEYFRSDKLVHFHEIAERQFNPITLSSVTKEDIDFIGSVWVELHGVFERNGNSHYCAIIEFLTDDFTRTDTVQFEQPFSRDAMRSDVPMLVDVPECVQSVKMSRLISIPAVVRLKRLHDGDCGIGDAVGGTRNPELCVKGILLANREANVSGRSVTAQESQLPCEMVKAGTQTVNKIARDKCCLKNSRVMGDLTPNDMPSIFQIILRRNAAFVRLSDDLDFGCQSIKMILRPLQLQVGVKQTSHRGEWYFNPLG